MHPDILREMTSQRRVEMQTRAQQARVGRMVRRARRAIRRSHGAADGFVVPAIPDFVDGSFRTEETVDSELGQAPAVHRAA